MQNNHEVGVWSLKIPLFSAIDEYLSIINKVLLYVSNILPPCFTLYKMVNMGDILKLSEDLPDIHVLPLSLINGFLKPS